MARDSAFMVGLGFRVWASEFNGYDFSTDL